MTDVDNGSTPSPKTRSSSRAAVASPDIISTSGLTPNEEEFAWLTEEYFFAHPNAKKKLAFWFVELHASTNLTDFIHEKKETMSESQWKKAGKINVFVKKSRMEAFASLREKVRRQLQDGFRRDVMRDQLPSPGKAGRRRSYAEPLETGSVSFSQDDDDDFDETGVLPSRPIDIKARHKRGDAVFAAWIDNLVEDGELSWFPGVVRGINVLEKHGHYGEARTYHIEFDDGDVDHELKDIYVIARKDYFLNEKGVALAKHSGILKVSGVGDEYAETVGWYKTTETGERVFGLLSDAVKARDEKVVEKKGQYVTEADLLFPEDWDFPRVFASRMPKYTGKGKIEFDDDEDGGDARSAAAAASPGFQSSPRKLQSFTTYDARTEDEESPVRSSPRSRSSGRRRPAKRSADGEDNNGGNGKRHKHSKRHKHHHTTTTGRASNVKDEQDDTEPFKSDLVMAHRLCSKFGLGGLSPTRFSVRFGSEMLVCKQSTAPWSNIDADSIATEPLESDGIHHAMYNARPDLGAVVHLRSPAATAISCLNDGFQFLSFDSAPFHGRLAMCKCLGNSDTLSKEITDAMAKLDACNTVLLRSNGVACIASSIRDAFFLAHRFEECCKLQLEVMKSGGKVQQLNENDFKQAVESGIAQRSIVPDSWDNLSEA